MTPQPIVQCSYEKHANAILDIFNEAILNSTALYDYKPRAPESMIQEDPGRQAGPLPEGHDALAVGQLRQLCQVLVDRVDAAATPIPGYVRPAWLRPGQARPSLISPFLNMFNLPKRSVVMSETHHVLLESSAISITILPIALPDSRWA